MYKCYSQKETPPCSAWKTNLVQHDFRAITGRLGAFLVIDGLWWLRDAREHAELNAAMPFQTPDNCSMGAGWRRFAHTVTRCALDPPASAAASGVRNGEG